MGIFCFAQARVGFKIGASGGFNYAFIKDKYYSDVNKGMASFDVGVPMEIRLTKRFAIQPEIHFTQKGFSLNYYGISGIEKVLRKRNFIEIPILFKFVVPVSEKLSMSLFSGVSTGYALTNSQKTKFSDGTKKTEKFPFDTNVDDDNMAYNKVDVSIPIGFDFQYKISDKIALFTDMRFNLDMTNNIKYKVKPSPTPSYKYRNFIISMGMNFILKEKE